jgi:hypothetical protein
MGGTMSKILFFSLIFISIFNLQVQSQINDYTISKVKVIQAGKDEGLIGWKNPVAGGYSTPRTFIISNKNLIYVPDGANNRINVYDLSFNYVKTIIESGKRTYIDKSRTMQIDDDENMYYSFSDDGLYKLDKEGKRVFFVDAKKLPGDTLTHNALFPIKGEVFFYGNDNEVRLITNNGVIENSEKAFARLNTLSLNNESRMVSSNSKFVLPVEKKKLFNDIRNEKQCIMIDDCAYIYEAERVRQYFKRISEIKDFVEKNDPLVADNKSKKAQFDVLPAGASFIGYDSDHDGYWVSRERNEINAYSLFILIYSKYGVFLDAFYYGAEKLMKHENTTSMDNDLFRYPTTAAVIAVAPSGDVYFLIGNEKEYTFYKAARRW